MKHRKIIKKQNTYAEVAQNPQEKQKVRCLLLKSITKAYLLPHLTSQQVLVEAEYHIVFFLSVI